MNPIGDILDVYLLWGLFFQYYWKETIITLLILGVPVLYFVFMERNDK